MPALPPVPATAQVNLNFVWNGEDVVNVFHVRNADEVTAPNLPLIGQIFKDWWVSRWRANISADCVLNSIKLVDLTSPASGQLLYTTDLPNSGGVGIDSVSNNVAALIIHGVGIRKRGVNGRSFIPGLPENATAGQQLATGITAALQSDFAGLISALDGDSYDLGIVSYYEDKVLREEGLFRIALTNDVMTQLASQKLRLHGRRRHKRPSP